MPFNRRCARRAVLRAVDVVHSAGRKRARGENRYDGIVDTQCAAAARDFHRDVSARRLVHCVVEGMAAITLAAIENTFDRKRAQNWRESPGAIAVRN